MSDEPISVALGSYRSDGEAAVRPMPKFEDQSAGGHGS
jgi:hypothetical protein